MVSKNASLEQDHVYFGPALIRTLRPACRNVKCFKKVRTHKLKKHWSRMKYPRDRGELLGPICSHGMRNNIYSLVAITPSFQ